jgi:hypothetical protein
MIGDIDGSIIGVSVDRLLMGLANLNLKVLRMGSITTIWKNSY